MDTTVGFLPVSMDALKSIISDSVAAGIAASIYNKATEKEEKEGYMSRKETCEFLHISLQTLNQKTRSGELSGYRFGARVLYKRSDLEAALVATNRYTVPGKKRGPKPKAQV